MLASLIVKSCFLMFLAGAGAAMGLALLNRRHQKEIEHSYRSSYRPQDFINAVVSCTKMVADKTREIIETVSDCVDPQKTHLAECFKRPHSVAVVKNRANK